MSSNQSLLRKADIAIADIQSQGGELQPVQAANFIRKMIIQPTILRRARVVEMIGPRRRINKIGFGARILRKAVSGTALTQSQRSKPVMEQLEMTTREQIAEVRLPYDVLEDNIERATAATNGAPNENRGGLHQTFIDLIAERAATDTEELCLLADTAYTSGDTDDQDFLSQFDGWLKIAMTTGNVVDAANATVTKDIFKRSAKTLPKQYYRNRAAMRFFVSQNNEIEYRDTLSNRATALGDQMTTGELPAYAYGTPVEAVTLMPEDRGLFTDPANLIFGIQRQVSMEFDKDITARVYIIVLTMRVAVEIEQADAAVFLENIAA
jgi:hypothetical protein